MEKHGRSHRSGRGDSVNKHVEWWRIWCVCGLWVRSAVRGKVGGAATPEWHFEGPSIHFALNWGGRLFFSKRLNTGSFSKRKITLIITLWRLSPNHGRSNVRVRIHRQGCWGVQMRPPVVKKVRACHPHVRESSKVIRGCCWIDGGSWGKVGDHRMNKCSISWSVLYQQPWLEIITLRNDEELEGKVTT